MFSYIKNIYIKICTLHVLKVIDNHNNMVTFCELTLQSTIIVIRSEL